MLGIHHPIIRLLRWSTTQLAALVSVSICRLPDPPMSLKMDYRFTLATVAISLLVLGACAESRGRTPRSLLQNQDVNVKAQAGTETDILIRVRAAAAAEASAQRAGQPTAGQPSGCSYVIQQGDTLWQLAQRWGTTVDALLKINPQITNRDLIFAGATLQRPC